MEKTGHQEKMGGRETKVMLEPPAETATAVPKASRGTEACQASLAPLVSPVSQGRLAPQARAHPASVASLDRRGTQGSQDHEGSRGGLASAETLGLQ